LSPVIINVIEADPIHIWGKPWDLGISKAILAGKRDRLRHLRENRGGQRAAGAMVEAQGSTVIASGQ